LGGVLFVVGYIDRPNIPENLIAVIHVLAFVVPTLFLAAVVGLSVLWRNRLGMLGWMGMALAMYARGWKELDPGKLARIVRENVAQFRDPDLSQKVHENAFEAQRIAAEAVRGAKAGELAEVETIKGEAEEIYARYRARLEALAGELNEELSPLDERLEELQQAVREKLEDLEPELPPLPEGETRGRTRRRRVALRFPAQLS
jgi:hypothetical protein